MIRKMKNVDINRVADIWLKTNLKAHYFIPEQYWTSNYELVKEMLLQAEVYVYEDNKIIQGFVGLSNEYIEIYKNGSYIGCLSKEFSFLTPHYNIDYNGWHIDGTIMEWDYSILD